MPLPLGEVTEHSEDGEGKHDHTKGQQPTGKYPATPQRNDPHERKLWYLFLRKYPVKIYKQRIIDRSIVDFYCASVRLVIEVDGSQHYAPQGMAYDKKRSAFLSPLGLTVLRFSNRDIDRDLRSVCEQIHITIQRRLQDPLSHLR